MGSKSQAAVQATTKYEVFRTFNNVSLKVPAEGIHMKLVLEHQFETTEGMITVETHWQNGMPVQGGFINRNFYGLSSDDLGKRQVGAITVWEKTMPNGQKYTVIDFKKNEVPISADFDLKVRNDGTGLAIFGTKTRLDFVRRGVKKTE